MFWAVATASIVDIIAANNATLQDAFQFGLSTDTWTLAANFSLAVKASRDDASPLVEFTTGAGTIVIDDSVNRIIHLNVPDTTIAADLPVGEYVYDLVMYDGSSPPVRTLLMQGRLIVTQGVTP